LLGTSPLKAQEDLGFGKLTLQTAPTGLFDVNGHNLPLGLDWRFADKFSVTAEVSIPFLQSGYNRIAKEESYTGMQSDFRAALELHHIYHQGRRVMATWGIQTFLREQQLYQEPGFYRRKGPAGYWENVNYSYADISKRVVGAAFIFDARTIISKRFSFSVMMGLGAKWSATSHSNMQNMHVERPFAWSGNPKYINSTFIEGNAARIYVPLNLKLCYTLVRSKN
jgi:hypothetical protein